MSILEIPRVNKFIFLDLNMRTVLRWIWEFPQCLLGLLLTFFYNVKFVGKKGDVRYYAGNFPGGISLGLFILCRDYSYEKNQNNIINHEFGHTRQSLLLGPLYLIIIGIPSILWAAFINFIFFPNKTYYWFYTERWADHLGGVKPRWNEKKKRY